VRSFLACIKAFRREISSASNSSIRRRSTTLVSYIAIVCGIIPDRESSRKGESEHFPQFPQNTYGFTISCTAKHNPPARA
jgi:hypothetical protein